MAKKRTALFVILGIVVLLTAVTFYVNRFILPVQIKKLAIAQAEQFLKRKVEIDSLHFNWVKGLFVDRIKVYQKDSTQVLAQAERVSVGFVFIPGFKQHHLTIPFIEISQPSFHLIRQGNEWNFSDLLTSAPPPTENSPVAVNIGNVRITDAKVRIDDISPQGTWTEFIDDVNIKAGLGLKGVTFSLSGMVPKKQGLLKVHGSFQPVSQTVQAKVSLANLRPADYMALFPSDHFPVKDGVITTLEADIQYSPDSISGSGNFEAKNAALAMDQQNLNGTVQARNVQFSYKPESVELSGDYSLRQGRASMNGLEISGDLDSHLSRLTITKNAMSLNGTLNAQNAAYKANNQSFKGDFSLSPVTVEMNGANEYLVKGDLKTGPWTAAFDEKSIQGKLAFSGFTIQIKNENEVAVNGKLALDDLRIAVEKLATATGSIALPSLSVRLRGTQVNVSTEGELNNWQLELDHDRTIVAEYRFKINASYPLDAPQEMQYDGTFNLDYAEAKGFPFGPISELNAEGTFKTDQVHVKGFNLVAMETALKGSATLMDFKNLVVSADVASDRIDLGKLKAVLPDIFTAYGLETSGEAGFSVQFQGLMADPLSGKINIKSNLKDVSVSSSKFNQSVSHITGAVEGTPEGLKWDNITGTYLNQTYTLTGELNNYKSPQIKTSLDGENIRLKLDMAKQGDVITIKSLVGSYFNTNLNVTGNVTTVAEQPPTLNLNSTVSLKLEDLPPLLPEEHRKSFQALEPRGQVNVQAQIQGPATDWKNWGTTVKVDSPQLQLRGYTLSNVTLSAEQREGKISDLTLDANAYDGKVHIVGSGDLEKGAMPFDVAFNVDGLDLQKLKADVPNLKQEEINGKFYLTSVGKGSLTDLTKIEGKGSLAVRDGYLANFKMFKGLLGVLNEALRLGQIMITDVEGNFTIEQQRVATDNLRLKGPTLVLLTDGWVDFSQNCDLNVIPDLSSGVIPIPAEDLLRTLKIHISGNVTNPKYEKKISVPQVINSIIKTIGIFK